MEDSKPHSILIVDDEKNIISALKRLLRNENYNIFSGNSGAEGLEILKKETVQLIISDQRMPGMNGTEFLSRVMQEHPDIIRIILSGYTDIDSITEAINKGHIYKFLLKPWNDSSLVLEIRQALDQYDLIESNRKLHMTVFEQNKKLKMINENLERIVSERTQALEIKNHALELSQTVLDDLLIPVIGVDPEGMVVLINKATQKLKVKNTHVNIGCSISDLFEEKLATKIIESINSGIQCKINSTDDSKSKYIMITPMSGHFKGNGTVITFHDFV